MNCSNSMAFRSSARRRKFTCAARTTRWRFAPSPAHATAGKTADKDVALEKELLADPKERVPNTSCWWTSRATTSGACAIRQRAGQGPDDHRALQPCDAHRVQRRRPAGGGQNQLRPDARDLPGGHGEWRAEDSRHADHRRPRRRRAGRMAVAWAFSFNGNLDTTITIRTALLKDSKAYVQAGGGWVNDSEPEAEFQETVNKRAKPCSKLWRWRRRLEITARETHGNKGIWK